MRTSLWASCTPLLSVKLQALCTHKCSSSAQVIGEFARRHGKYVYAKSGARYGVEALNPDEPFVTLSDRALEMV